MKPKQQFYHKYCEIIIIYAQLNKLVQHVKIILSWNLLY